MSTVSLENKTILVTGAAGFIGSNLVKRIYQEAPSATVIGIDNMNAYYDVALKEFRLNELAKYPTFTFIKGNIADKALIMELFEKYKPSVVVNLAAQAGVRYSITNPDAYVESNLVGFFNILEACRHCESLEHLVYASSSSVYGSNKKVPYSTDDKVDNPVSLYAATKKSNELMVKEYRDAYGMFAVNGILFNHESERRGENFVTRKITLAAGRIAEGLQDHLELGNMDSLRDWGYAKDYVECMWLIMQQEKPDDFVIATGVQHTVRDFTEKAFAANGITIRWEGTGIDEKGYDAATGKMLVCVNPQWFRPTDVDNLWGDPTKAKTVLGWNPQSTTYEQLVEIMAKHDRERAKREKALKAVL